MVTTKKLGGIGAIGSGSARFFHPGDRVREKYPPNTWARVTGTIITSKAMRLVARRQQFCYLVTVPDIDGKCYIVKKNFRVNVAPEISFKSECAPVVIAPPWPIHREDDRAALNDVVPNVRGGAGLAKHIAELRAEGVEVNNNNEPLDEGGAPPPPDEVRHRFEVPSHCPPRERNLRDDKGKWAQHRWGEIAAYTKMELFRMAFPEEFVETGIIPTTNDHLGTKLMLGEFYNATFSWHVSRASCIANYGGQRSRFQCTTRPLSVSMESCR